MKVILIGNYPPDKQESMKRFADMLYTGLQQKERSVEMWLPAVVFGSIAKTTTNGYGKWLGYVDKWIFFPLLLRWKSSLQKNKGANTHFHICDHSNAPYLAHLSKHHTSITCHDVLAIRGALGYADAYCPASSFGKLLQRWIFKNLLKAQKLAAVSQLTFDQLIALTKAKGVIPNIRNWQVIHNAFNSPFYVMEKKERTALLAEASIDIAVPFLLHVGSALPRKNRQMLVEMIAVAGTSWTGNIVFAGQPIDEKLNELVKAKQLQNRVISVVKPDHLTLVALYSGCAAFVFPSLAEGFGWPVIEAQACGAPIIASNLPPLPEVSGNAALHADPLSPQSFAAALISLQDDEVKKRIIAAGFENIKRFAPATMIKQYAELTQLDTN